MNNLKWYKFSHFSKTLLLNGLMLIFVINHSFCQISPLKIIKFEDLQHTMNKANDSTLVVHFWATWCKPCIEELPHFEELAQEYRTKKVIFLLVSLDFVNDIHTKVEPFLLKNSIKSQVVVLDEPDYNSWIESIDKEWSGAIPATLIINTTMRKRNFTEGAINIPQFISTLKSMLPLKEEN